MEVWHGGGRHRSIEAWHGYDMAGKQGVMVSRYDKNTDAGNGLD
jgi:hypothetical protein